LHLRSKKRCENSNLKIPLKNKNQLKARNLRFLRHSLPYFKIKIDKILIKFHLKYQMPTNNFYQEGHQIQLKFLQFFRFPLIQFKCYKK